MDFTLSERDGGLLRVDGVEDSLVANLRLGDEADLGAQVGPSAGGHDDGRDGHGFAGGDRAGDGQTRQNNDRAKRESRPTSQLTRLMRENEFFLLLFQASSFASEEEGLLDWD